MKKFLLVLVTLAMTGLFRSENVKAQQIYQLSQYMLNDFAYNPAVAGATDMFKARVGYRKQWAGIDGAPSTFYLSVHGNLLESRAVGLGATVFSDVTGPTRRTGFQLAYAYQVPLIEDEMYLGIGLSANLTQYSINFEDLILVQNDDPQLANQNEGKLGADANFGLHLSGDNFYAGLSINQLAGSKYKFDSDIENIVNDRHIYLMGGYNFEINDNFAIEPGLLMKLVKANSPQFEINARAFYQQQYWLGLSYRTEDAIAIMLGIELNNGFNFAYSYDITTSALNTVSNGAHEIMLGFDFSIFGSRSATVDPREF